MLLLKDIVKKYDSNENEVTALRGVSIEFRKNEFVSILGHSGCGKTTLLNIIGGLDKYTSGDLVINGKSTKEYKDADWDTYRNHCIGFVFQSYNLIPHQTVLANVELALTLSGVSKNERTRRAKEALAKVGLADQIKKKPNQLSGGQMQRVAIARALVNDPEILLADEPTGALDSDTSVQIMDMLKEVAKDRLVIMVTHNPELAELYSTRIVRLVDGNIISDSMPYDSSAEACVDADTDENEISFSNGKIKQTKKSKNDNSKAVSKGKKRSMSLKTALSLSLNNLMTKKARTVLTSFAGSIGIIGIALILSLSTGIQAFITQLQEDTLSSYPITITSEEVQLSELLTTILNQKDKDITHEMDKVYSSSAMFEIAKAIFNADVHKNDLEALKAALDADPDIDKYVTDIQYMYAQTLHIYSRDPDGDLIKINPSTIMTSISSGLGMGTSGSSSSLGIGSSMFGMNICSEMINNADVLSEQYDIVAGEWPKSYNEVVLVVDENNELNDLYMYALGLKDPDEIKDIINAAMKGESYESQNISFTYEDILSKTFSLVLTSDYYQLDESTGKWVNMSENENYVDYLSKTGLELKISGIVKPSADSVAQSISGAIGYTHELAEYVIEHNSNSEAVKAQLANPTLDIFENLPFDDGSLDNMTDAEKAAAIVAYFDSLSNDEKADIYKQIASTPSDEDLDAMTKQYITEMGLTTREAIIAAVTQIGGSQMEGLSPEMIENYLNAMTDDDLNQFIYTAVRERVAEQFANASEGQLSGLSTDEIARLFDASVSVMDEAELADLYDDYMPAQFSSSTFENNKTALGITNEKIPSSINIYASTFEDKDRITEWIANYNANAEANGNDAGTIKYTDYVGLLMSSVTTIVDIVSIVLIAFVGISLVVSAIMIGVITYISVIERTKEIGILRAIGASKKDIKRVFNAETTIIGLVAGAMGIVITIILLIPTNIIVENLTSVPNIAQLPVIGACALIAISVAITLIAGLFPAKLAAKKDPVVALRTE